MRVLEGYDDVCFLAGRVDELEAGLKEIIISLPERGEIGRAGRDGWRGQVPIDSPTRP